MTGAAHPEAECCYVPRRLTGTACPAVGSGQSGLEKSKEEAHHTALYATGELKVHEWLRWTVGSWQLMEDLGWRLGNCEYCYLDLAPILAKA